MPSKKRRRAASADANAATHGTVAASFELYPLLPLELREAIIKIACLSPQFPTSPHPPSPFGVDSGTTFSLSLVCRQINTQVTPLLWKSISITRPSSLYALREALLARPDRRQLIVSLHIGPQDVLPSYWWPLSTVWCGEEYVKDYKLTRFDAATKHKWIVTSLNKGSLPSDCLDRQAWNYERRPAGCRDAAIYEAIKEAERSLEVSLLDSSEKQLGQIERVMLVQAALDLYLENIRQVEEKYPALLRLTRPEVRAPQPCRTGPCHHYPALHVLGIPQSKGAGSPARPAPQPQAHNDAVVVTYAQILRHIRRPGALADRFDHPIIFERSGFKVMVTAPSTRGSKSYYPSSARYSLQSSTWSPLLHAGHRWEGFDSLRNAAARPNISKSTSDSYSAVIFTATLGPLLDLAQNVLYLTRYVQNLSLTGSLHSAVGGTFGRALPGLHRLSLGPTLPNAVVNIDCPEVANLKSFRIGGEPITTLLARSLLANAPQLKRLHWGMEKLFVRQGALK